MKILLIDQKDTRTAIRAQLIEDLGHAKISVATSYQEGEALFLSQVFNLVIIDFTLEFGEKLLDLVLKKNPSQHIITISDDVSCSETLGCEFCSENYNKRRILKSSGVPELLSLINNFEFTACTYYDKFPAIKK